MVLQRQVETMITRFGCSENLYQIVGQLWLRFLKKYYEHIYKDSDKSDETSQVVFDGYENEDEDKDEQAEQNQSDPAANESSAPPGNNTNINRNVVENVAQQPASSDSWNNTNATDKSNIGDNNANNTAVEEKIDKSAPSIKPFLSRKKPKFSLTACFIYLGCLWCREALDISDIMRWMRSGELPFVSVINSLPRNIDKISFLKSLVRFVIGSQFFTNAYRQQYFPTSLFLTETSKKLSVFLDFYPPPLNPPPFVYRLFQDLNFPRKTLYCMS